MNKCPVRPHQGTDTGTARSIASWARLGRDDLQADASNARMRQTSEIGNASSTGTMCFVSRFHCDCAGLSVTSVFHPSNQPRATASKAWRSAMLTDCNEPLRMTTDEKKAGTLDFSRVSGLYRTSADVFMVPRRGLEPPRLAALVPETSASTNFAIWARGAYCKSRKKKVNDPETIKRPCRIKHNSSC